MRNRPRKGCSFRSSISFAIRVSPTSIRCRLDTKQRRPGGTTRATRLRWAPTTGTSGRNLTKSPLGASASMRSSMPILLSPNPRWANPGIFVERRIPLGERMTLKGGARVDFVSTNVIDDPADLENLGLQQPQSSLVEILRRRKTRSIVRALGGTSERRIRVEPELANRLGGRPR